MLIQVLLVLATLTIKLDGDMGHWDPDMWGHMFPFNLMFGIPMMWFYIIFFLGLLAVFVILVVIILRNEGLKNSKMI